MVGKMESNANLSFQVEVEVEAELVKSQYLHECGHRYDILV